MENLCNLIDRYAKLSYVVRRLNAKINRLPDFLFSTVCECDYRELGLDEETIERLENSTSGAELRKQYDNIFNLVEALRVRIYDEIYHLSLEDKNYVFDYVNNRADELANRSETSQNNYLLLVAEIEKAESKQDADKIRTLGRQAKTEYSKYYELDSIKNTYMYLGCYMRSMVKRVK